MSAGHGAERIAAELGVSLATAKRRMKEIRGAVVEAKGLSRQTRREVAREPRARVTSIPPAIERAAMGDGDDEESDAVQILAGSSVEEIDAWLKVAKEEAELAATDPDPDNRIKWVRLAAMLLEMRRKAMPIPKPDPNEDPDMIEAATRVRKRWHALADRLAEVSRSPLADMIRRLLRGEDEED